MLSEEQTFIKKLVFRFISKHISGTTLNSALDVTKSLNSRGIATTVTFLNDHIRDSVRARYNLNSYMQLMKQISRLNLNSGISVRLSQLGSSASDDMADKGMRELLEVARNLSVPIWIEYEAAMDSKRLVESYRDYRDSYGNIGLELPIRSNNMEELVRMLPRKDCMLKLTTHSYADTLARRARGKQERQARQQKQQKQMDPVTLYSTYAKRLSSRNRVYILENDEKALYKIATQGQVPKKDLIIELPLGYSAKWLKKLTKKKLNMGVYVPYGKDWIPYALNKLSEGRIRNIAVSILNGESSGKQE